MKAFVFVLALVSGGCPPPPLAPGEVRCSTSTLFGVTSTRCQQGQPQPQVVQVQQQYAPPPPAPVYPWWCAKMRSTNDATASACERTRDGCIEMLGRMRGQGWAVNECEPESVAACYYGRRVSDGRALTSCSVNVDDCERERNANEAIESPTECKAVQ